MATSIIKSLADVAAQYAAKQIFAAVLGSVSFGGGGGGGGGAKTAPVALNSGGYIRRAAVGYANPNRDSVHALVRPGEYVLRNSAVDMIGKENLDRMNALGNSRVSKGVSIGDQKNASNRPNDMVNIYVVSPDQKPQMTPKDVVVAITEDLSKGGATKKLVKSIQLGKA
jgi:lambda family phage tail tape measure protein